MQELMDSDQKQHQTWSPTQGWEDGHTYDSAHHSVYRELMTLVEFRKMDSQLGFSDCLFLSLLHVQCSPYSYCGLNQTRCLSRIDSFLAGKVLLFGFIPLKFALCFHVYVLKLYFSLFSIIDTCVCSHVFYVFSSLRQVAPYLEPDLNTKGQHYLEGLAVIALWQFLQNINCHGKYCGAHTYNLNLSVIYTHITHYRVCINISRRSINMSDHDGRFYWYACEQRQHNAWPHFSRRWYFHSFQLMLAMEKNNGGVCLPRSYFGCHLGLGISGIVGPQLH